MSTVNVNTATPWQLMVLLDLPWPAVEALLLARPFAGARQLQDALGRSQGSIELGLEIPKRNINSGSADDLVRSTGIPAAVARQLVEARPYYHMEQLRPLAPGALFDSVSQCYGVPELKYVDKTTGRSVTLAADLSQVLVARSESEGMQRTIERLRLKRRYPSAVGSFYDVFTLPESESAASVLEELRRVCGRNVLVSYRDESNCHRHLNPKYCVVQFRPQTSPAQQAEIVLRLGLTIRESHRTSGLYTLRVPEAQTDPTAQAHTIRALNVLPEVEFAEPNYLSFDDRDRLGKPRRPGDDDVESVGLPWNLSMIRASQEWRADRGSSNVVIAVIDSGVDQAHPAIRDAVLARPPGDSWNFASTSETDQEPTDSDGHGTFIAGLLVGNGAQGVYGICPGCRVLPLKVPLQGEVSSYARRRDAILYALETVPADKRLIINLSWKTDGDVALIRNAIEKASVRGALVVASAGNMPSQENETHFPSDYASVISVAALAPNRSRAYYSYYGNQVDLAGPGGDDTESDGSIASASPGSMITTGVGTSFAAPHVAGIAALVASANPELKGVEIRSAIESSAVALPERGLGRGLVDTEAALIIAGSPVKPSPPRGDSLSVVNSAEMSALITRFGLLRFTARLLVARRPIRRLEEIRGLSGLTEAQYRALAEG